MNIKRDQKVSIPLGIKAHEMARKFALEQIESEKCKQVYLNTLSVYAAHRYLKLFGIETNLNEGDCWNPLLRYRWNIADLIIPEVGTLECRPVLPEEQFIRLPKEVIEERIGYLAIQFSRHLDQVKPLGFARPNIGNILQINNLIPVDQFIGSIYKPYKVPSLSAFRAGAFVDNLWQPVRDLLSSRQLEARRVAFRSDEDEEAWAATAKRLSLPLIASEQQLTLVMRVGPEVDQEIEVLVEVHPVNPQEFLPLGLKVKVSIEDDSIEVKAESDSNFIQVPLAEKMGKKITVEISLGDEVISEEFII